MLSTTVQTLIDGPGLDPNTFTMRLAYTHRMTPDFTPRPLRVSRPELNFAPPFADLAVNAEGFNYWWTQLQYVFDLPNPHRFPRLTVGNVEDARRLKRFVAISKQLAEGTLLSYPGELTLTWNAGEAPKVATDKPSIEAIRGFCVTFRQVASDNEAASYTAVRKVIGRLIHEQKDAEQDQRTEWHARWNRARGKLNAYSLRFLAESKIHSELGYPNNQASEADVKPLVLIKKFQYGDLLHWGDTRDDVDKLVGDEVTYAFEYHQFVTSLIQLTHFYLGYACLVERVLA